MILYFKYNFKNTIKIFKEYPFSYLAISLFGFFGHLLLLYAMFNLDLSMIVMLEKLQPIFVVLIGFLLLKEKFSLKKIPFMILALIGSFFISVKDIIHFSFTKDQIIGIVSVVLGAFFYSITTILGKKISKDGGNSLDLTYMRFLIVSVLTFPFLFFTKSLSLNFTFTWWVVIVLIFNSIFCTAFAFLIYYKALKFVKVSTAAFLELITPIVGAILALIFLKESFTIIQIFSALVLLFSVYRISKD
jgi:drug/metabolite transporter (DMT)-like permease